MGKEILGRDQEEEDQNEREKEVEEEILSGKRGIGRMGMEI